MPSPFPGMDPFLEGYLWPDVHQALAYEIRRRLAPRIRPRYLTRLAITNYVDYDPAPIFQVRTVAVEVYDVAENRLVTGIEILSPINKRQPDLKKFQEKFTQLRNGNVHILVIDLLRRGQRPITSSSLPDSPYLVTLTRDEAHVMKEWPIQLNDKLPVVPVPLWPPDEDVPLDLSAAMATIYDEGGYDLSIDYTESPPPPALNEIQKSQMKNILSR